MSVQFQDFSVQVKEAINETAIRFLYESGELMKGEAANASAVDTGQLRDSWDYKVSEGAKEVRIGSPLENAIWEEFGTGEYAAAGNGRKGGWVYVDEQGKGHFTRGKRAKHSFMKAFTANKSKIIRLAEHIFRGLG